MKKILITIVLAGLFVSPALGQNPPLDKNWQIVFMDTFNTLNTNRWWVRNHFDDYGGGFPVYLNQNVYIVNNQRLVLEAKKEAYCCPLQNINEWHCKIQWLTGKCYQYTSGCIYSQNPYKYGYFEIYAKLPGSNGYYPTFWLHNAGVDIENNNCWYNEIDIFEINDCVEKPLSMDPIWDFTCPNPTNKNGDRTYLAFNYADGYHWYGLEWDRDKITWYIDRKAVKQRVNDQGGIGIQNAMYIIIALSLHAPGTECPITSSSIFPDYMYIEQANVWRLKYDCNTVVTEILNYDNPQAPNYYNYAVKKLISLSGVSSLTSGQNVSLRATDYIELKNGFEVPLGAEFYVDINPCDNAARVKKQN